MLSDAYRCLRASSHMTINPLTFIAILFDSVAPLVKTISLGSAPISDATCYKKGRQIYISAFETEIEIHHNFFVKLSRTEY